MIRSGLPADAKGLKVLNPDGTWTPVTGNEKIENLATNPSFERVEPGNDIVNRNLILNPSFESGIDYWNTVGDAVLSHETVGTLDGYGSLRIDRIAETTNCYAAMPETPEVAYNTGEIIEATVRVRNDSGREAPLRFLYGSSDFKYDVLDYTLSSGEIREFKLSTEAKSNEPVRFWIGQGAGWGQTGDSFVVDSVALGTQQYFDGDTSPQKGFTYEWTGIPNESSSVAKASLTTLRENLFTNPSFESSNEVVEIRRNYATNPGMEGEELLLDHVGTIVTKSSEFKSSGEYSQRVECSRDTVAAVRFGALVDGPSIPENTPLTVSAVFHSSITNQNQRRYGLWVRFFDVNNVQLAEITSVNDMVEAGNTKKFSVSTVTPPDTSYYYVLFLRLTSEESLVGDVFYIDDVLIERSNIVGEYFDGSTPADGDYTYSWTGTPHASESIQQGKSLLRGKEPNSAVIQSSEWASSGSKSLRIIPTADHHDSFATLTDKLNLKAGNTYTILAKLRLSAPLTGSLENRALGVYVHDGTFRFSDPAPNEAGVHEIRHIFTLDNDASIVRLYNGASAGNGDVWWDDVAVIEGEYTGPYFDGSTFSQGDFLYAWEGVPNDSKSIQSGVQEDSYHGAVSAVIRSSEWSSSGQYSGRHVYQYHGSGSGYIGLEEYVERGKTYTVSVKCRLGDDIPSVGDRKIKFRNWISGEPGEVKQDLAPNISGVHQLQISFTVPEEPNSFFVRLYHGGQLGDPDVWWDDLIISEGVNDDPYFDGDNPPDVNYIYRWTGEPHNSTSIGR